MSYAQRAQWRAAAHVSEWPWTSWQGFGPQTVAELAQGWPYGHAPIGPQWRAALRPGYTSGGEALADGSLGFLPWLVAGGVAAAAAWIADRWTRPDITKAQIQAEAQQVKLDCLRALERGEVTQAHCAEVAAMIDGHAAAVGVDTNDANGWGGLALQAQKFMQEHGATVAVGVLTTVIAAVALRAFTK